MKLFDEEIDLKSLSGEELAEEIATNMYSDFDRKKIFEYPEFIRTAYFIIDFDSELSINGIGAILENSIGEYVHEIIKAFECIGDTEEALLLTEIVKLVAHENISNDVKTLKEFDINSFLIDNDIDEETEDKITKLVDGFYIYTGFDMWGLLFSYLDKEIEAYSE